MSSELPIIAKVYEILLWTLPHLAKLPRTHRFLAADLPSVDRYGRKA